jgi:hypothetical protein
MPMVHHDNESGYLKRLSILLLTCSLAFTTSLAYAVTKSIAISGANGEPLANTSITIVFPNGTEQKKDTDEKGILVFDFPDNGTFKLLDPGGKLVQTVSTGGIALSTVGIAAGALAVGAIALSQNNDSSSSSSGSSTTVDPSGTYTLAFTLSSNPGGHPDFLSGGPITVTVSNSGGNITITQTTANANFTDTSGTLSGANITSSGTGSYAGFSGIQAQMNLTYDSTSGTVSGTYVQGAAGGLPGGQAITWTVSGS